MSHLPGNLHCVDCGEPVSPDDDSVLREVIGWSKPREAGGQNHVRFRRETGRLMCSACALARQYGGSIHQTSLMDEVS